MEKLRMEYRARAIWAVAIVIIIAIVASVVYLGASNYLGSGSATTTTLFQGCSAYSGFSCSSATFHNNVLSMQFWQNTGTDWKNATVEFVPYGSSTNLTLSLQNGLADNQSTTLAFLLPSTLLASTGSMISGRVIVTYTTSEGVSNTVTALSLNLPAR